MQERRYATIKQLPIPDLRGGRGDYIFLDPKIKDLVKVVNALGYRTLGSCGGHIDGTTNPYPWITVLSLRTSRQLAAYVGLFNRSSEIKWTAGDIFPYKGKERPYRAKTEEELLQMQQSAQNLVEFLFNRYLAKKP